MYEILPKYGCVFLFKNLFTLYLDIHFVIDIDNIGFCLFFASIIFTENELEIQWFLFYKCKLKLEVCYNTAPKGGKI